MSFEKESPTRHRLRRGRDRSTDSDADGPPGRRPRSVRSCRARRAFHASALQAASSPRSRPLARRGRPSRRRCRTAHDSRGRCLASSASKVVAGHRPPVPRKLVTDGQPTPDLAFGRFQVRRSYRRTRPAIRCAGRLAAVRGRRIFAAVLVLRHLATRPRLARYRGVEAEAGRRLRNAAQWTSRCGAFAGLLWCMIAGMRRSHQRRARSRMSVLVRVHERQGS